jgi:hypothetical protein
MTGNPWEETVADLVRTCRVANAGTLHLIAHRGKNPQTCVIVIDGKEECKEVLAAIAQVEARWEEQKKLAEDSQ